MIMGLKEAIGVWENRGYQLEQYVWQDEGKFVVSRTKNILPLGGGEGNRPSYTFKGVNKNQFLDVHIPYYNSIRDFSLAIGNLLGLKSQSDLVARLVDGCAVGNVMPYPTLNLRYPQVSFRGHVSKVNPEKCVNDIITSGETFVKRMRKLEDQLKKIARKNHEILYPIVEHKIEDGIPKLR